MSKIDAIKNLALSSNINLRYSPETVGISISEADTIDSIKELAEVILKSAGMNFDGKRFEFLAGEIKYILPHHIARTSKYLQHPIFNTHHSETQLLRYMKSLENKDLSLTTSMIPLGSCTMKLNATAEMIGVTWPEFSNIHPFAPLDQAAGYMEIINEISKDLSQITQFPAISLQPKYGAQGEYTGLMVIRQYHVKNGSSSGKAGLFPEPPPVQILQTASWEGVKLLEVKRMKTETLKSKK